MLNFSRLFPGQTLFFVPLWIFFACVSSPHVPLLEFFYALFPYLPVTPALDVTFLCVGCLPAIVLAPPQCSGVFRRSVPGLRGVRLAGGGGGGGVRPVPGAAAPARASEVGGLVESNTRRGWARCRFTGVRPMGSV